MATKKTQAEERSAQVKTFKVFGYVIQSNSCKTVDFSLYVKKFGEYVKHSGFEQGLRLSMNHIQIWELIDEATRIDLREDADEKVKWLVIETKDFVVSVKIPQEKNLLPEVKND